MEYRNLGGTGLKCSVFSLGTWLNFSEENNIVKYATLLNRAFELGINLIDTAEIYSEGNTDGIVGKALSELNIPRENYLLSSKVFWGGEAPLANGLTKKHLRDGCEKILKKYNIDYLDILICHRFDNNTPLLETIIGINLLIQQGKVLYWGTSEWPIEALIEAHYLAKTHGLIGPSIEQLEYNLLTRKNFETNFLKLSRRFGTGSLITMPLAYGILTGKYLSKSGIYNSANRKNYTWFRDYLNSDEGKLRIKISTILKELADKLQVQLVHLALAWIINNIEVNSIILGCSNLEQLEQNIESLKFKNLFSEEVKQKIEIITLEIEELPKKLQDCTDYNIVREYG